MIAKTRRDSVLPIGIGALNTWGRLMKEKGHGPHPNPGNPRSRGAEPFFGTTLFGLGPLAAGCVACLELLFCLEFVLLSLQPIFSSDFVPSASCELSVGQWGAEHPLREALATSKDQTACFCAFSYTIIAFQIA